ncbi:uncharacterized protein LOC121371994 [Gigantopelta aegis]|uniref:uncharacterized protein LOC121371994 n=1 Tax=Gigantopelta aegis TaxID=1735272 RepID=UPI001B88C087|nr:uncharacterized protein LOC121371994 [Gigantopelta aegis]
MKNCLLLFVVFEISCLLDMCHCRSLWGRFRNYETRRIGPLFDIPIDMETLDELARLQFNSNLLSNINEPEENEPRTVTNEHMRNAIPFGVRPRIRVNPTDVTEPFGATVTLHCHVSGPGLVNVRWVRSDGQPLSSRARQHGRHKLTLSRLNFHNSGRYICRAANKYGVSKRSVVVSVVDENGTIFQRIRRQDLQTIFR